MAHEELRRAVWQANLRLVEAGLVVLTWGNASAIDREAGVVAIKPSGVAYDALTPELIALVDLETGALLDASGLNPSSDTPTHLAIYRAFPEVGGVVHTHSRHATAWAQACREIPCLGTTHADQFYGPVPLTRHLEPAEIDAAYEAATGDVIVERFRDGGLDPIQIPGVLVPCHGPFAWGRTVHGAVESAVVLEEVAALALVTEALRPNAPPIPQALMDKHFLRKHGPRATYGQRS